MGSVFHVKICMFMERENLWLNTFAELTQTHDLFFPSALHLRNEGPSSTKGWAADSGSPYNKGYFIKDLQHLLFPHGTSCGFGGYYAFSDLRQYIQTCHGNNIFLGVWVPKPIIQPKETILSRTSG